MEYVSRCVKFRLPNGHVVDVLTSVLSDMRRWAQNNPMALEGCGFLMGYKNSDTQNITLSAITTPQKNDERTRFFCRLRDKVHFRILAENRKNANYYMGVWHTHPQNIPQPSATDWKDWNDTLCKDVTGAEYAFFVIIGLAEFRIWAGESGSGKITEIFEATIVDNVYVKGNDGNED